MGGIGAGDLVVHEYKRSVGILVEVLVDQKLMRHPFSVPWRYRVLWADGIIGEHDMGTLRRVAVYDRFGKFRSSGAKRG